MAYLLVRVNDRIRMRNLLYAVGSENVVTLPDNPKDAPVFLPGIGAVSLPVLEEVAQGLTRIGYHWFSDGGG